LGRGSHARAAHGRESLGADPANAKSVLPTTRHVLIRSSSDDSPADRAAARRKATAALARIVRGEDFAKVARDVSEDPGSKDKGGAYPGEMVEQFVEPYRLAYTALAPGQVTKQLVETQFGFHVIKKDAVDHAARVAGFRRATAMQTTRRLADDLAERLKPAHAEASATRLVSEVVISLLGSEVAKGDARPDVHLLRLAKVPSPPPGETCAKLVAVPPETVVVVPLAQEFGFIVAKAGTDNDADEAARATAGKDDTADGPVGYCRAAGGEALTAAQIREMIEKAQKAQRQK
jgi:hypothetical protein